MRNDGVPLVRLNELEYIDGEIWANIWYDDRIARISPADGKVLGSSISPSCIRDARGSEAVLNGIALRRAAKRLFVTGKTGHSCTRSKSFGRDPRARPGVESAEMISETS